MQNKIKTINKYIAQEKYNLITRSLLHKKLTAAEVNEDDNYFELLENWFNTTALTPLEQFICIEYFLSLMLRKKLNLTNYPTDTLVEIIIKSQNLYTLFELNPMWVKSFLEEINLLIAMNLKEFNQDGLGMKPTTLSIWYSILILRSVYSSSNAQITDDIDPSTGSNPSLLASLSDCMDTASQNLLFIRVKREDVVNKIQALTTSLSKFNENFDWSVEWKKYVRVIMLLEHKGFFTKHVYVEKNTLKTQTKPTSAVFLELATPLSFSNKMHFYQFSLEFSTIPYSIFYLNHHPLWTKSKIKHSQKTPMMLGASYLSVHVVYSRSKFQKNFNEFQIDTLIKLSSHKVRFSVENWEDLKKSLIQRCLDDLKTELTNLNLINMVKTLDDLNISTVKDIFYWGKKLSGWIKVQSGKNLNEAKLCVNSEGLQSKIQLFRDVRNRLTFVNKKLTDDNRKNFNLNVFKDLSKISNIDNFHVPQKHVNELNKLLLFIRTHGLEQRRSVFRTEKISETSDYTFTRKDVDLILRANKSFRESFYWQNVSKKIQEVLQRWIFIDVLETGLRIQSVTEFLYLNHFYDFRGRIYSHSPFHPMYNKLVRVFIELNDEVSLYNTKVMDCVINTCYFQTIRKFFYLIPNSLFSPVMFFKENTAGDLINKLVLSIVLIQIGQLFKTQILEENKTSCITVDQFFAKAILILKMDESSRSDYRAKLSFEDGLQLDTHVSRYVNYYEDGLWRNFIINTDATGSTFQCWSFITPLLSKDIMSVLNLSGLVWYDVYSWVINLYKAQLTDSDMKLLTRYLVRKTGKRSIMTLNYNVTEWRSLEYFLQSIWDIFGKNQADELQKAELKTLHGDFFSFLENQLFQVLYAIDRNDWINKNSKNFQFQLHDKTTIDLAYYKYSEGTRERAIKAREIRWKFKHRYLTGSLDFDSSKRAFPANSIQAVDAWIARSLVNKSECLTIHDCFVLRVSDFPLLVDELNKLFDKHIEIKDKSGRDYALFSLL